MLSVLAGSYVALATVVRSKTSRPNFCPECGFSISKVAIVETSDGLCYEGTCSNCKCVSVLELDVEDGVNEKDTTDK